MSEIHSENTTEETSQEHGHGGPCIMEFTCKSLDSGVTRATYTCEHPEQFVSDNGAPTLGNTISLTMDFPPELFKEGALSEDPTAEANQFFAVALHGMLAPVISTVHQLIVNGNLGEMINLSRAFQSIERITDSKATAALMAFPIPDAEDIAYDGPMPPEEALQSLAQQGVEMLFAATTMMYKEHGKILSISISPGTMEVKMMHKSVPFAPDLGVSDAEGSISKSPNMN